MNVLDDYMVDPRLSLLDKTRIQAQVLVPVLRALRAELGQEKADAIVRQALRDWSKQLFAAVGESVEGSPRRKWAAMQTALTEITEREVTLSAKTLHMRVDYNPYEGKVVRGAPAVVLSRGEVIVDHGSFKGRPGRGAFVKRQPGRPLVG